MLFGFTICVLASTSASLAEKWSWPEGAASVRIDTKVRFIDHTESARRDKADQEVQADEVSFEEPTDTEGFYNRPPGSGKYPVRVQSYRQPYNDNQAGYSRKGHNSYSDGTLDSLQYCKCVSSPDCSPHLDSARACGAGKFLCCYKHPNKNNPQNTEFFNEIEDERPALLPGREGVARPFPPPPGADLNGALGPGHAHEAAFLGTVDRRPPNSQAPNRPVLVGPNGPTGVIGPAQQSGVLVGPSGSTGVIGPTIDPQRHPNSQGPSRDVTQSESAQRGVLVGPGGPTGIIGPGYGQRPVLVGPGGPTGVIGPYGSNRGRGVLVGPGGPTGIIGPYDRRNSPGVLVGPGGPTGIIGPGRPILVGPGGPTGQIGPRGSNFFGK